MIFISYRRDDSVKDAIALHKQLQKYFSERQLFIDLKGLNGGVDWLRTLDRQVASSKAMLVLIGPAWTTASNQDGEHVAIIQDRSYVRTTARLISVLSFILDGWRRRNLPGASCPT